MADLYLQKLQLVSEGQELSFVMGQKRTCYKGVYPFKIFPQKGLQELSFAPVTVLYGGNGSGKTTLLNILAEKLGLTRHSAFSGSAFFGEYTSMCRVQQSGIPRDSQILTSDDVSDYLLNLRALSDGIDTRRERLLEEYSDRKWRDLRFTSLDDYDQWKEGYDAKRRTSSRFVNDRLMKNPDMRSNGETAMNYYTQRITENALYLIDEPENSLSAAFQRELAGFLADSARFFGCQFVISTHSPFLLAIPGAVVYDLDSRPVRVRPWTELENMRVYFSFFRKHENEFKQV
ncbi:MAG: AAA family ATPase [Clostridia bacterium]|nr:AAA family ATPase [Clostridia bacterium]